MQFKYFCPFCEKDTIHNIHEHPFVDGKKTTSEIQCSDCLNHVLHVKHDTGKMPTYHSPRVLYPHNEKPVLCKNIHFTHSNLS